MQVPIPTEAPSVNKKLIFKAAISVLVLVTSIFYHLYAKSPREFPSARLIAIEDGSSIQSVALALKEESIIRAPRLFSALVRLWAPANGVIAGEYSFPEPLSVFGIVRHVTDPVYGPSLIRVTIPEGLHNREIAELLDGKLTNFDTREFIRLAESHEGYLFPDTYFLTKQTSARAIVALMQENFNERLKEITDVVAASGRSLSELLTMASILEKEARSFESRRKISGILWKRLEEGMRLQVDAVFLYILNKGSFELTLDDLKTDSPYNTYKYEGLPPGPINNPGLASIRAAAMPADSPYWFYLSDTFGDFHFARTYEEHKANKRTYLR
ncbi:MAG: endolytic transglycosylase MltG [Candidatus Vogelbacteria bacterium]|nr:endolytic transglycosylase MltG [Candidatus Vogelbacteria bacterium]